MGFIFLLWLCVAAVIDARFRICFNWVVVVGLFFALVSIIMTPELHPVYLNIKVSILTSVTVFFIFLFFYKIGLMGGGDVKFGASLGAWVGWDVFLMVWALSCCISVIHGVIFRSKYFNEFLSLIGIDVGCKFNGKRHIPYVTYLSLATIVVLMLDKY